MATLGGHPKFKVLNKEGNPLAGGKIYTYQPGTTTPKDTYTDAAEGTANTNPIILDSRGEADLWYDGTYKIVVKDSVDNTIWVVDNVDVQTLDVTTGLLDANGNVILKFDSTSTAVNNINLTNAATGNGPTIGVAGDDTNIDLEFTPKGTGKVVLSSTPLTQETPLTLNSSESEPGRFTLAEDTDNGTNTITVKAPGSLAASRSITLPSEAPTNGYYVSTDASGVWSYTVLPSADVRAAVSDASTTVAGLVETASTTEMTAGSSTTTAATPGRAGLHPSSVKGWLNLDQTGTQAIDNSYNVASITDIGTGATTVTWDTDFANANYAMMISAGNTTNAHTVHTYDVFTGSVKVWVRTTTGAGVDQDPVQIIAYGDQ